MSFHTATSCKKINFPSFKHPFTAILAGLSQIGKSTFLKDFLSCKNYMIEPVPNKIVWFYAIYQKLYHEIQDVTFIEGFPPNYMEYLGMNTLFWMI